MILNQELQFESLPRDVQSTFVGRQAEKRLLSAGHQLFKFTQHPLEYHGKITPWWSSVLPINGADTGLEELLKRCERMGVSPSQFARARNAVTRQWNSMDGLLLAELTTPAYGFAGPTAHQRLDSGPGFENVFLIGGAIQLWIPNLTIMHVRKV